MSGGYVSLHVVGLDNLERQMDDIARGPGPEIVAKLDEALAEGYAAMQAILGEHYRTGRTSASATVESFEAGGVWTGRVTVGVEGEEGEHLTGAKWLLANGTDYLEPLDELTSRRVGEILDSGPGEAEW